jgi:hypothetical protein
MKTSVFNILVIAFFAISSAAIAAGPLKKANFAVRENLTAISYSNYHNRIAFYPAIAHASALTGNTISPQVTMQINGMARKENNGSGLHKLLNAKLRLSFRLSDRFNLLITYN